MLRPPKTFIWSRIDSFISNTPLQLLSKFHIQNLKRLQSLPTRTATVVPTKSDSVVILCLQLLSKSPACKLHLSQSESIAHLSINPIHRIGLIHKWSIDYKPLITLETKHEVTVTLGWQDSTCAVYLLLGALPIEAGLHKCQLSLRSSQSTGINKWDAYAPE